MMRKKNVRFVLIQIDEAHSTAWPIGALQSLSKGGKEFLESDSRGHEESKEERKSDTEVMKAIPTPQTSISDRISRAEKFTRRICSTFPEAEQAINDGIITILVDTWENDFGNTCQAWPDVYYCVDSSMVILAKSTYGKHRDALIDVDCLDVLRSL